MTFFPISSFQEIHDETKWPMNGKKERMKERKKSHEPETETGIIKRPRMLFCRSGSVYQHVSLGRQKGTGFVSLFPQSNCQTPGSI